MSKTYRLYQYIDVEVEDEKEIVYPGSARRVRPDFVNEFIQSTDDGAGIGVEFLGENVEPYSVEFAPVVYEAREASIEQMEAVRALLSTQ